MQRRVGHHPDPQLICLSSSYAEPSAVPRGPPSPPAQAALCIGPSLGCSMLSGFRAPLLQEALPNPVRAGCPFSVFTPAWETLPCCTAGFSLVSHKTPKTSVRLENGAALRVCTRKSLWVLAPGRPEFASWLVQLLTGNLWSASQAIWVSFSLLVKWASSPSYHRVIGSIKLCIKMAASMNNAKYIVSFHCPISCSGHWHL